MIKDTIYPKTKQDLIKALQRQRIQQIEVIEPYDPSQDQDLTKTAKAMFNRPGDVTIIMVRTQ
jgi:hypothetical protein